MKIRPVGAELFHLGRRMDRHDKANSCSSQFCKRGSKCGWNRKKLYVNSLFKNHQKNWKQTRVIFLILVLIRSRKKKLLSRCSGYLYQLPVTELMNKLDASVNQMIILLEESHPEPAEFTPPHETQIFSKIHPILRTSYLLIPRSEVLLEKVIVSQLVQKFPALS